MGRNKIERVMRNVNKDKFEIEQSTSTIFFATFGEKWRTTVCAENSVDANILYSRRLVKFNEAGVDRTVKDFPVRSTRLLALPFLSVPISCVLAL